MKYITTQETQFIEILHTVPKWVLDYVVCHCIVLYTVHFTAFCLGAVFSRTRCIVGKTSWTGVSWGSDRWNVVNDYADVWRSFHVCWPTTRKVCCTTNIILLETEIYLSIHWRPYSIRSLYVSCNAIKQFVFVSTTFEMLLIRDIWFFHIGLVVFLFNFLIFIAIRIVSCFLRFL